MPEVSKEVDQYRSLRKSGPYLACKYLLGNPETMRGLGNLVNRPLPDLPSTILNANEGAKGNILRLPFWSRSFPESLRQEKVEGQRFGFFFSVLFLNN